MNYYLLFLSLYSLCILPLVLRVECRLGKGLSYRLRIRLTGLTLHSTYALPKDKPEAGEAGEGNLAQSLRQSDPVFLRSLLSPELWRMLRGSVQCRGLWVRVRVAMEDAAATALCYRLVTVVLDALRQAGRYPSFLQLDTEASFSGNAGEIRAEGIFLVRLGSLALVASRFARSYLKTRDRLEAADSAAEEEERHAASHR